MLNILCSLCLSSRFLKEFSVPANTMYSGSAGTISRLDLTGHFALRPQKRGGLLGKGTGGAGGGGGRGRKSEGSTADTARKRPE